MNFRFHYNPYTIFILIILLSWISGCQRLSITETAAPDQDSMRIQETIELQPKHLESSSTQPLAKSTFVPEAAEANAKPIFEGTPQPQVVEENEQQTIYSLMPERWMEWEVVPTSISPKMRTVYQKGLALGNNPRAFSKVGDCQNICEAFLCLYDKDGYKLYQPYPPIGYPQPPYHNSGSDFSYLQETIDYFAGSWGRESIAVEGGFNFPAVFSPLRADPEQCKPGESPLVCELRLHKPSFVIIGMEYWYKGRTAENYEKYLRKAVDYALEHGTIPILEAKADNLEGDHSINLTTARVAYEKEVPFWNFWRAVQKMDDHGMDVRRDHADGFHITYEAQLIRSFTALQTLDALRRMLLDEGEEVSPTPTLLIATASPTLMPTENPLANQNWQACPLSEKESGSEDQGGKLMFGISQNAGDKLEPLGAFMLKLTEVPSRWERVLDEGVGLLDSPSQGCWMLVHEGPQLYLVARNGKERILISEEYDADNPNGAQWFRQRQQLAFIHRSSDGRTGLMLFNLLDGKQKMISTEPFGEVQPLAIYNSPDENHLYWESGSCTAGGKCVGNGVWLSGFDERGELTHQLLEGVKNPLGAPDGKGFVFIGKNERGENRLYWQSFDNGERVVLDLRPMHDRNGLRYPAHILNYRWADDGQRLAVIGAERSKYSGRQLDFRYFIVDLRTQKTTLLPQSLGDHLLSVLWLPKGDGLIFSGSEVHGNSPRLLLKHLDLSTMKIRSLEDNKALPSSQNFLFIQNLFWIP